MGTGRAGARPAGRDAGDSAASLASVDLPQILALLRRRWWVIVLVAIATAGATSYYVSQQRPLYQAEAVIRLVDTRQELTGGLVDAQQNRPAEPIANLVQSEIQVLLSRAIAGEVVDSGSALGVRVIPDGADVEYRDVRVHGDTIADSLQLRFTPTEVRATPFFGARRGVPVSGRIDAALEAGGVQFAVAEAPAVQQATLTVLPRNQAIDLLLTRLSAQPREDTDVIDVAFIADEPEIAQQVVNSVVEVFREANLEGAHLQARNRRAFVDQQIAQNDSLLADAERALALVQSAREQRNRGTELSAGAQAALSSIEARREELNADRVMLRTLLGRLEQQRASGGDERSAMGALVSSAAVAASPVISQYYAQLSGYQRTRDSLTTGPAGRAATHPDVRRLDALIEIAQDNLLDAARSYLASLETRISSLDTVRDRMQPRQATGPEVTEASLIAQVEGFRGAAAEYREAQREARIAEAAEVGEVEIVDLATLPDAPIGMTRWRKTALGALLGVVLGIAAAFLVEMVDGLNSSIRRRSEIESLFALPALGLIPPIADLAPTRRLRLGWPRRERPGVNAIPAAARHGANGAGGAGGAGGANGNGNGSPVARGNGAAARPGRELVMLLQGQSPAAEAYRSLRTNLLFSEAVHALKTLVLTSSTPAEGKTTTAANLAMTFAQQGVRVLLVDCDLRRPRVHSVFAVDREPGLTNVLLGQCAPADAIRTGVGRTHGSEADDGGGLMVLPAGKIPPNPSELLGGTRMRDLLDALRGDFDLVMLDSPPVLVTPDAAVLGALADGVLLVVRAGHAQQDGVREALRQLAAVDARVLGSVLNDPDAKVAHQDRRYSYGYGGYAYYAADGPTAARRS